MNLLDTKVGKEYIIERILTGDDELNAFLFSLGCYTGERITVISKDWSRCIVAIKDGRYCIDNTMAQGIEVF